MSFALLPVTSARVSGTVINSKGQPLTNASINAMTRVNGFGSGGGGAVRDGRFSLTLTPGDYTLRVMMPGGPPTETETALLDISVAGTDIADLMLVTANPSTLRGRFVFEPGDVKLPERSIVRVSATAMSGLPGGASATAKDDMTFEMKSMFGRIMLRAPVSNEWRMRSVTLNGVDVTDTGLQVPANATIDGLVVQLTTHLGQLSIRVLDDAGALTRDCQVVVFPRDPARWTPMSRFISSGRPNLDGVSQPRLPAGDYLVAAFVDDSPSGLWNDPDVQWWYSQNMVVYARPDHPAADVLRAEEQSLPMDIVHPRLFEDALERDATTREIVRSLPSAVSATLRNHVVDRLRPRR
jgi:hypothetical protein